MAKTIWEKRGESRYFMCQHNSLFSGNSLIVKIIYLRMCAMRSELVLQGVVVLFHSSLYLKFQPKALFLFVSGPREREGERVPIVVHIARRSRSSISLQRNSNSNNNNKVKRVPHQEFLIWVSSTDTVKKKATSPLYLLLMDDPRVPCVIVVVLQMGPFEVAFGK